MSTTAAIERAHTRLAEAIQHAPLYTALTTLTPLEQRILDLLYGLHDEQPHTHREAAAILGKTHRCVHAHHYNAMAKLRRELSRDDFPNEAA